MKSLKNFLLCALLVGIVGSLDEVSAGRLQDLLRKAVRVDIKVERLEGCRYDRSGNKSFVPGKPQKFVSGLGEEQAINDYLVFTLVDNCGKNIFGASLPYSKCLHPALGDGNQQSAARSWDPAVISVTKDDRRFKDIVSGMYDFVKKEETEAYRFSGFEEVDFLPRDKGTSKRSFRKLRKIYRSLLKESRV